MTHINTLICMREEDCPCPFSVKFDFGPNYWHESHYGKHTIIDYSTGLILEWSGDNPEEGTLKKDGAALCIVIPKGREQEEYLVEQKQKMIEWYEHYEIYF